jgi:hypothetical protein
VFGEALPAHSPSIEWPGPPIQTNATCRSGSTLGQLEAEAVAEGDHTVEVVHREVGLEQAVRRQEIASA